MRLHAIACSTTAKSACQACSSTTPNFDRAMRMGGHELGQYAASRCGDTVDHDAARFQTCLQATLSNRRQQRRPGCFVHGVRCAGGTEHFKSLSVRCIGALNLLDGCAARWNVHRIDRFGVCTQSTGCRENQPRALTKCSSRFGSGSIHFGTTTPQSTTLVFFGLCKRALHLCTCNLRSIRALCLDLDRGALLIGTYCSLCGFFCRLRSFKSLAIDRCTLGLHNCGLVEQARTGRVVLCGFGVTVSFSSSCLVRRALSLSH